MSDASKGISTLSARVGRARLSWNSQLLLKGDGESGLLPASIAATSLSPVHEDVLCRSIPVLDDVNLSSPESKNGKSIGSNSSGETNSAWRCRLLIGCGWRRRDGGGTAAYPPRALAAPPARPRAVFLGEKSPTRAALVEAALKLVCPSSGPLSC
ncbi:unnamed protein product [Leptosia nina]|uniref:Uncharacterized protein n=1 Tax=Leptosia nina TaxID=320188 RepID=A0AAV1JLN9_9NEOP